jgi:hypothetical protein
MNNSAHRLAHAERSVRASGATREAGAKRANIEQVFN